MRFALLGIATAGDTTVVDEKLLGFCCALAQQCFLNEYVYACTEEEARGAQSLHASVSDALASGRDVPALRLRRRQRAMGRSICCPRPAGCSTAPGPKA
jgi:hypothetical protein